ncbi:MAG: hypothetical protein ACYC2Y_04090 [Armatimonadota bacterium]
MRSPAPPVKSTVRGSFKGARVVWGDSKGKRLFVAEFDEAEAVQEQESSKVSLKGVSARLYGKDGRESTLSAPAVTADSATREVQATGGVKLTSSDGTVAECERLVWKSREDKVLGTGSVAMRRKNLTIIADALEADTSLSRAKFKHAKMSME